MTTLNKSTQEELRRLVDQIERLEEEKQALTADIRDKFLEAKGRGFDVKILRKILSLRKKSASDRAEEDALVSTYLAALGMLPLEEAIERSRRAEDGYQEAHA